MKSRITLIILTIIITIAGAPLSNAVSPNFYHRIDVSSGNLYTFVASNLVSAGINKVTEDRLLDTSFEYTYNKVTTNGVSARGKDYNRVGLTAKDLFSDSSFGVKLGYQSFNFSWFNWGLYASAHCKFNRFKWEQGTETYGIKYNRFQPGVGLMISFGDMESSVRFIVEGQLKYNMPIGEAGDWGDENSTEVWKSTFSSHYTIRFAGSSWLQGIGIFAEIPHGNPVKWTQFSPAKISLDSYTFGITYTICPWNKQL